MSFWDGIQGKIYGWNKTVETARVNLCHGLRRYTLNHSSEEDLPFVTRIREHVFAHWLSAISITSRSFDKSLVEYKNNFYAMKPHGLLRYMSSLNFAYWITYGKSQPLVMFGMIDALGEIYGEPKDVSDHWKHIATAPDDSGFFLMQVRGNFIADAIGRPQNNLPDAMYWRQFSIAVAESMNGMMNDPRWSSIVDEEIRLATAA